jgi:hypothetical protein
VEQPTPCALEALAPTEVERPRPAAAPARARPPKAARSARRPWLLVAAVLAGGAVAGLAVRLALAAL